MSQKRVSKLEKGERIHRFFSLSHSRLYVRFQISICKVNFQRIGLNRRVSLSRLLRTEKPFKNIFFYAVARHEMMVSGYEKKCCRILRHFFLLWSMDSTNEKFFDRRRMVVLLGNSETLKRIKGKSYAIRKFNIYIHGPD